MSPPPDFDGGEEIDVTDSDSDEDGGSDRVRVGPTHLFAAIEVGSRRHSGVHISEPIPRADDTKVSRINQF